MGGKSTSHSAVLGDKHVHAGDFDLRSWQGLTQVLKTAKDSLRDPGAYAEFRDLVLHYAQQGGDAEIRRKIDAILATFPKGGGVTIPVVSFDEREAQHEAKDEAKKEERKVEVRTEHKAEDEKTADTRVTETQSKMNTFIAPSRRIAPQFQKTTTSQTTSQPPQKHTSFIPEEITEAKVEIQRTPTPPPPPPIPLIPKGEVPQPHQPAAPQGVKTLDEYKNRIIEIKRAINTHVGNPAALIDTPNDLGKKYMTALLSALKATGGGGSEGVDGAMQNLEHAYAALMAYVPGKEEPQSPEMPEKVMPPPPPPPPVPKPEPIIEDTEEELREVVEHKVKELKELKELNGVAREAGLGHDEDREGALGQREDEKIEETPAFIPPQRERKPVPPPYNTAPTPETERRSASRTLAALLEDESMHAREETPMPKVEVPPVRQTTKSQEVPPPFVQPEPVRNEAQVAESSTGFQPNKYTNKGVGSHSPALRESGIDPSQIAVKQAELFSPEITASLHQLLEEWTLFNSSGLFGIGPSGPEHPMYLTLAPLSMGEVVAGRWEGSDMKTVKVLKQYIDAWRHEQGIAYTINETFEHYLRRVVQRILKRQG